MAATNGARGTGVRRAAEEDAVAGPGPRTAGGRAQAMMMRAGAIANRASTGPRPLRLIAIPSRWMCLSCPIVTGWACWFARSTDASELTPLSTWPES